MSRSSQILLVTFDASTAIDPLTVSAKNLAEHVESYLQRVAAGPLDVAVSDGEAFGVVHQGERLLAAFSFVTLGGAR